LSSIDLRSRVPWRHRFEIEHDQREAHLTGCRVASVAPEVIDQAAVEAIATVLRRRAAESGVAELGEPSVLEPATVEALGPLTGDRVEKSRNVGIPQWGLTDPGTELRPGGAVGQVDIAVPSVSSSGEFSYLAELKWCGPGKDILYEGIWDGFKMALGTQRPETPRTYSLLTGAQEAVWQQSPFADLFDSKDHDPVELCMRDVGGRDHRLAWDCLLEGGYDRYPDALPPQLRTIIAGRASIDGWQLRAVEVQVVGEEWIPLSGGWPRGERPEQARYPKIGLNASVARIELPWEGSARVVSQRGSEDLHQLITEGWLPRPASPSSIPTPRTLERRETARGSRLVESSELVPVNAVIALAIAAESADVRTTPAELIGWL
jgi:hypothetical protein